MSEVLDNYLKGNENLLSELPIENGIRKFPLRLPEPPIGRSLGKAWLELPMGFSESGLAKIKLSPENVLKIPHVESDGKVCFDNGDPGASSGASSVGRIQQLIESFYEQFLEPWYAGELDGDFHHESQSYWLIYCTQKSSTQDAVFKIYTLNNRPNEPRILHGTYLTNRRVVIVSDDSILYKSFINSMSEGRSLRKVLVADIPVSFTFTPDTWPKDYIGITRLLRIRLGDERAEKFLSDNGRRGRAIHRIVLLRAPDCSFGYLLPGGPPNVVRHGYSYRVHHTKNLLPLLVDRLDPSWTCGRDQHPEILDRQKKHVLVIGAGALGSPVIAQLAKSGIGYITIIDNDYLSAANIGRHVLGAESIGKSKAMTLSKQMGLRWPSCKFVAEHKSMQSWLKSNDLSNIDMILDLTGEPEVRLCIDAARKKNPCLLVIGWMEPYVAAAHACALPDENLWMIDSVDRLEFLQAIPWQEVSDVMQHEPSCSSVFQSYTPAAATHAVALVTETALDLLDEKIKNPIVRHWVRGQKFLDACHPGLCLREWALPAASFDGVSLETKYE